MMECAMSNKRKYILIFFSAIGFRIAMYLVAALIIALQTADGSFTLDTFLSNWCRWDAEHYMKIAENGYFRAVEFCDTCREAVLSKGVSPDAIANGEHLFLVFYPLFPFVLSLFYLIFTDIRIAGLILSTLTYAGGCVYMYRLVKLDYSETVAVNSVILLSLFPFSFFFGGIMTEGVFFLISSAMLYYIRKHKWWTAILFGCLATMTRMQGVLLIIPAGLELLCIYRPWDIVRHKDFTQLKAMIGRGLSLLLIFVGTGVYLLINWMVEGHPFIFLTYQESHWDNGAAFLTETLSYVFNYTFSTAFDLHTRITLWMPQAVLAVVCAALLIYGIKKLRAFHMGYAIGYVLLTYSVAWLISAGRYLSCCIPLFITLALATEKRKWMMPILIALFSILQTVYTAAYFKGMPIM